MGDALAYIDLGADFVIDTISLGGQFSCALANSRAIKCWGHNNEGQLGLGLSTDMNIGDAHGEMGSALNTLDFGPGFVPSQMSVGYRHACVVSAGGVCQCWGLGTFGQLGQGSTGSSTTPLTVPGVSNVALVSAEVTSTCVVDIFNAMRCWGYNGYGALGYGDNINRLSADPVAIDLGAGFVIAAVTAGHQHRCVWSTTLKVKCWGYGYNGQLGTGSTDAVGDSPGQMGDDLKVLDFGLFEPVGLSTGSASSTHHCVFADDGMFKCWGKNDFGQLGVGDTNDRGNEPLEMGNYLPLNAAIQFMTRSPTTQPTPSPTAPTTQPTQQPTGYPSQFPSTEPTTVAPSSLSSTAPSTIITSTADSDNSDAAYSTTDEVDVVQINTAPIEVDDDETLTEEVTLLCVVLALFVLMLFLAIWAKRRCRARAQDKKAQVMEMTVANVGVDPAGSLPARIIEPGEDVIVYDVDAEQEMFTIGAMMDSDEDKDEDSDLYVDPMTMAGSIDLAATVEGARDVRIEHDTAGAQQRMTSTLCGGADV